MGVMMRKPNSNDPRGILLRALRGLMYAAAGGLFLLAVDAYLHAPPDTCGAGRQCPPAYIWPILGMALCGAVAASLRGDA